MRNGLRHIRRGHPLGDRATKSEVGPVSNRDFPVTARHRLRVTEVHSNRACAEISVGFGGHTQLGLVSLSCPDGVVPPVRRGFVPSARSECSVNDVSRTVVFLHGDIGHIWHIIAFLDLASGFKCLKKKGDCICSAPRLKPPRRPDP